MILVNLSNSITGTFRSLARGKPESAIAVQDFIASSAPCLLAEVDIEPEGIRIGSAGVAEETRMRAWGGRRGCGHDRERPSTQMSFSLESQQHEQKSRGFGL
jgi:hypothetical protein